MSFYIGVRLINIKPDKANKSGPGVTHFENPNDKLKFHIFH